jgi:hypothetical protein
MKQLLCILCLLVIAGCDGSAQKSTEAQKAADKAALSGDFGKVKPLDLSDAFSDRPPRKPEKGHEKP